MKLNVIFIKGKYLIFIFLTVLLTIIISLLFFKKFNHYSDNIPTIAKVQYEEYLKDDLNGDGIYDLLYINYKNNNYYIESHINNKTYCFNPKNSLNTLGNYSEAWPISVKLMDLNNDSIPEILTQASLDESPITHIFQLQNNEFKDIFCSTNNFIGFLNTDSNTIILTSTINDFKDNLKIFILSNNLLKKIDNTIFLENNVETLKKLIYFFENKQNFNYISNLISDNISSQDLSLLTNLDCSEYKYTFQNCFLEYDKNTSSYKYILNFKQYDEYEENQLTLNISINNFSMITSIK